MLEWHVVPWRSHRRTSLPCATKSNTCSSSREKIRPRHHGAMTIGLFVFLCHAPVSDVHDFRPPKNTVTSPGRQPVSAPMIVFASSTSFSKQDFPSSMGLTTHGSDAILRCLGWNPWGGVTGKNEWRLQHIMYTWAAPKCIHVPGVRQCIRRRGGGQGGTGKMLTLRSVGGT